MPISDEYVLYQDFAAAMKTSNWSDLVKLMSTFLKRMAEQIEDHKQLSRDTADQYRILKAKEEYGKLIAERKDIYKKEVGEIQKRRVARMMDKDVSATESEGDSDN